MFRFELLFVFIGIILPAFLFGRAVGVIQGILVGIIVWILLFLGIMLGDIFNWFSSPWDSFIWLILLLYFGIDVIVLSILASIAVSKPDEISVADLLAEGYASLPPEKQAQLKAAARSTGTRLLQRMADKHRAKHPLLADIFEETGKIL
jgi:hypothetical protein